MHLHRLPGRLEAVAVTDQPVDGLLDAVLEEEQLERRLVVGDDGLAVGARTEAGDGDYGRIKSTAGIALLLAEGLGDTIRVSLTEAPEKEIPVCYSILQALGLRKTMVEYVACPSCGRTLFNLEEVLHKVRNATSHLTGLDIAVMGCIVNGPGEMADADYGYVGKIPGTISLYRGRDEIRRVTEAEGVTALIALIQEDGRWVDP